MEELYSPGSAPWHQGKRTKASTPGVTQSQMSNWHNYYDKVYNYDLSNEVPPKTQISNHNHKLHCGCSSRMIGKIS